MGTYNRVILLGNICADLEVRYTTGGTAVADMRLAVENVYQSGGELKKDPVFIDVTLWDKTAENCAKHLRKGHPVHVEGRLEMDQWQDRETGKNRTKLKVRAFHVTFIHDGRSNSGESDAAEPPPPRQSNLPASSMFHDDGEEIPF